ncbi:glucose 1-dehydrogenase, partial [Aureobasidium melanogenum]
MNIMGKKRVLVSYGVDVDAVSGWIETQDGSAQNSTNVSRGIFGATVGVDRLLKLFDKHDIKATFFTPAHTIESFPKQMTKVKDAGHEIGLHGYTHEHICNLSASQQRDVLAKSIEVITNFTGRKPQGYTAPAWATSKELIPLLEESGVIYDHYKIVEVPANWHLDDWPPLQPTPGRAGTHGFVSTREVEKLWLEQFDYAYETYDSFIFAMSIHPQVSGKPQVIKMHERIIECINQ